MKRQTAYSDIQRGLQMVAMAGISGLAVVLTGATIASFSGVLQWLELPLIYNGQPLENAGMITQISVTVFLGLIALYLPSQFRILNLEKSHRNFQIRMEDVANAYWATHRADRTGVFQLRSEFDAVKERILWLRDHPDLHGLEPDVMEVAAQMSHQSADLARIYSDEQVERAKAFIAQRIEETERLEGEIDNALTAIRDVRRMSEGVDLDEAMLNARANTLYDELISLMDDLHIALPEPQRQDRGSTHMDFPMAGDSNARVRPTHPGPLVAAE